METPEDHQHDESGKLRRWVSNLQLESWQLELLITGFSIFLLANSLEGYDNFRRDFAFNKLRPDAGIVNPMVAASVLVIVNSIPWVLRFLLINLLVHLLLRGFWIGIVGLSSVSATIYYEKLRLKGRFKKFISTKVKPLDSLIVYVDKISSVIFAYTYLLVFSILSVVIVISVIFSLFGLSTWIISLGLNPTITGLVNVVLFVLIFCLIVGAIIFFLDTLLFSAFKKSGWFSVLYYPIYRFYSVISLSILYRSIYYHLITNFKKKQITFVVLILMGLFFVSRKMSGWNNFKFYPSDRVISEFYMSKDAYDDTRGDSFVDKVSIPSKFIKDGYLELFLRYDSSDNDLLEFLCPDSKELNREIDFTDGFRAGISAQQDSTGSLNEFFSGGDAYSQRVSASANCASDMFEIWIDGNQMDKVPFIYFAHANKGEKGYLAVLDILELERGQHTLEIRKQTFAGVAFMQEITADKLSMDPYVRMYFWTE